MCSAGAGVDASTSWQWYGIARVTSSGTSSDVGGRSGCTGIQFRAHTRAARAGGGDLGSIGHGADRPKRFGGLYIGGDDTVRSGINTREILAVSQAAIEYTISIAGGGVIGASDSVKDVLAVVGGVGSRRITRF